MSLVQTFYLWLDLLWIPLALLVMEKGKKFLTCLFILGCVLLLRLQLELMHSTGFAKGFFGWIDMGLYERGLISYGVFIAFFMAIAYISRGSDKNIHLAASLTILIVAFCVSSLVMAL